MHHRKKGVILGRKKGPRKLLLRNLATSLVLYEKMKTTEAKAKAVRPFVERAVTLGKRGSLDARRRLLGVFLDANAAKKVMEVLAPRYKERPGGYTRIVKLGIRKGDAGKTAIISFV